MHGHVCSMISLDPDNANFRCSSPNDESVRTIWYYILEKIMRQGGPFAGIYKSDQLEEVVNMAVKLFPNGVPDRRLRWKIPDGVTTSDYVAFLTKVFTRTVPTPISDHI